MQLSYEKFVILAHKMTKEGFDELDVPTKVEITDECWQENVQLFGKVC